MSWFSRMKILIWWEFTRAGVNSPFKILRETARSISTEIWLGEGRRIIFPFVQLLQKWWLYDILLRTRVDTFGSYPKLRQRLAVAAWTDQGTISALFCLVLVCGWWCQPVLPPFRWVHIHPKCLILHNVFHLPFGMWGRREMGSVLLTALYLPNGRKRTSEELLYGNSPNSAP